MNLGIIIKDGRKLQKLTQSEFASLCGITQTYLSQIESNLKEPNLSTLKVISENLQLPLPILFFLSLDIEDVDPSKREAFKIIKPSINAFISEFFSLKN